MYFERFVSLRYLKAKRRTGFISVIAIISMGGVALGVCALIVVLAVMNGFQTDVRDRILGVNAHVVALSYQGPIVGYRQLADKIRKIEGVTSVTPFIYSQAMLSANGRVTGTVLRGIDPVTAEGVTTIAQNLLGHDPEVLIADVKDPRPGVKGQTTLPPVVVGRELARQLMVGVGSVVRMISPTGRVTPLGRTEWHRDFIIVDLFRSGMYEYDSTMSFLSLENARSFLGLAKGVTGLEMKVADIYRADRISRQVSEILGDKYWTRDWMEMNRPLFSALKLEKTAMFIILILIVLVAAFNIISTLIMVVMEKTKDIAILKSIGATSKSIMKIFVYQGLAIGAIGTGLGLASGLVLCEILRRYKFIHLPADVYYLDTLPVRVDWLDVGLIAAASVAISFLATLYPSLKGSRLDPVEALRYE